MACACRFALKIPENLPLVAAAPLLCAGITTYSPMKHYGLDKKGQKLAVVGLGGLGHMAVKFGKGEPLPLSLLGRQIAQLEQQHLLVKDPKQAEALQLEWRASKISSARASAL